MANIPERDISGHCAGERRDRVGEGVDDRQQQIAASGVIRCGFFSECPLGEIPQRSTRLAGRRCLRIKENVKNKN